MGIRKKIFYITAAAMLSILLVSYGIMYLFFYHVMFEETVVRQRASVELNRQMADNFVQSVYHTAVQLVSVCPLCHPSGDRQHLLLQEHPFSVGYASHSGFL